VELFAANPAKIFRMRKRGTLKPGSIADVTIIDPDLKWVFDVSDSRSKSRNTPFGGRKFRGAAAATIVGGRIVYCR
jgi:dihydroorotase